MCYICCKSQSMLEAKDLKIGNLTTNAGGIIIKITPEKISDLSNKLIILNPIELTEEWLLRFGFYLTEKSSSRYSYRDGYYSNLYSSLWISKNFYVCIDIYYPEQMLEIHKEPLKFVHQLQNLFYALTQTELTLKDEK